MIPTKLTHTETELMTRIVNISRTWLLSNREKNPDELLYSYYENCKSGFLKVWCAEFFDSSTECLTETLPAFSAEMSSLIAEILPLHPLKLRSLVSFITYWLIQYHADNSKSLPSEREMKNIIRRLLK